MGLNFIAYSEDIHDLFMANQLEPHETLTFPRVEGHENAHDTDNINIGNGIFHGSFSTIS